ncbi:MAG TPA: fibronectin type III domain-containing protein [Thermoanaerobaculia bacterium]|nr:fibronectin type III domain-containing protein [Thermoanaerobaculia bacterium]
MKGSRRLVHVSFLLMLFAFFADPFDAGPAFAAPAPSTAYSQVPVPSQLILTVRETAGVPRVDEVVRSGVPMPRSLNLRSVAGLAVVDASGTPVPAEFKITARWNAGKNDTTAPIQWLLVSFPATVGANSSANYRVVTDGSVANPAPARAVTVTRNGNAVTVDTGAAIFRLGANSGMLFDEVVLDNGTRLIGGGNLSLRTNGADWNHSTTREVWIEHQGPLTAVIQVQGAYDVPPIGDGQMSTRRRYVFTAGSPTAVVRHVVNWEGTLACVGCVTTSTGATNGVRIERLRDELRVELGGTPSVTAVGNFGAPAVTGTVGSTGSAWVRQQLRPGRKSPRVFDVNVGGTTATGTKADGGVLAASGPAGTVAVALDHMHRYEPQALRLLPGGSLAVDLADDKVWLTSRQGLFATLAVTAVAGSPSRQDLDRLTWAPLNRPLHAWAQPEWFVSSDAVDEFPVGPLPADLAAYDTLISSVLNATVEKTDAVGLNGLMTFGLYPRYWAEPGYEGEVDCGAQGQGDPTPGEAWDNTFWCGAWTDYHNTTSTAQIWAMRTGAVEWLDEIAFPAALRVLHTQIIQCSPTERWFYCGQAPAGYGAYRTDFNSSHAYLENLYLYYWMTGDATVIDILQRGADNMRRYVCNTRGSLPVLEPNGPGGPACADDHPVNPEAASLTGRVGQQWLATYRFMGLASNDASFLEDVRSSIGRSVTQFYADLVRNGVHYGFWGGPAVVSSAGTYTTDSQWTVPMYDMNNLWRFLRDTGDAPVGIPAVRPSQVMANVARTFKDIEPAVIGDGSPSGFWARLLQYSWSGSRLGGSLTEVVGADRELYNSEKGGAPALLVRAGQHMAEPALLDYGRQTTLYMLNWSSRTIPLSKLQGQNLTRLHAAVGRLVNSDGSTPPPPPPPPPPPAAPAAPSALAARSASQTEIVLEWRDNSSNEAAFHVEQSTGGGAFQQIQTLGANVITTRVTGLDPATTYTYRVRASNGDGHSPYSNSASATTQPPPPPGPTVPADPAALVAQAVSETEVVLDWQDNSSNESLFHIERQVNGVFQEIQTVGANITTARIGNLASGATHSFRVRASNDAGASGYTNTASANTPVPPPPPPAATPPAAPSKLQVVTVEATEITLSWRDNSNDETQFHIEQRVGNTYQRILAVGANVTEANITGLKPNTTYTFRVRASNAAGFSDPSNAARGKTLTGTTSRTNTPTAPTNLKIRHLGSGTTEFTWNDNSTDEVRFQVEELVNRDYVPRLTVGRNATRARLNLRLGVSYTFRIRVTDAAGQTAVSRPANINVFR